jgi:hypothetical protein
MGPAILFDKSAIQGLGQKALAEVSRYFYTVVPHVLLMETLADLSLKPDDLPAAQKKVADIACKVFPIDSIANAHYHTMCIHNLLGDAVPMTRIPAVAGGTPVVAADGSKGVFIDVQSENEAVLRWRSGQFNSDDMKFAIEWRKAAKGANLEEMKQALPKPPVKLKTPDQVREFADLLLAQDEAQLPMLMWFMSLLRCDPTTQQQILVRWKFDVNRSLSTFAPYAFHCLRVHMIYYIGMLQGVFGTRPSNIVDLEYLCYTPFAFVFCSGDKLHQQLAPLILCDDQSFVSSSEMHKALNELAGVRESDPDAEPSDESLIQSLWQTHWKRDAKLPRRRTVSEEQSKEIMEAVQPIMDAITKTERRDEQKRRFPL